jgi:hypothetical protein
MTGLDWAIIGWLIGTAACATGLHVWKVRAIRERQGKHELYTERVRREIEHTAAIVALEAENQRVIQYCLRTVETDKDRAAAVSQRQIQKIDAIKYGRKNRN